MLIFFGELRLTEGSVDRLPTLEPVGTSEWKHIRSENIAVQFCDFSPRQDKSLLNERYAAAISGDPVITQNGKINANFLGSVSEQLLHDRTDCIKMANGVFCGFLLDKIHNRLKLFTDYLGLRKVFIAKLNDRILFANTQWLIEKLLPTESEFDELSIIEMGVLGYALGNRTRRKQVELLAPGSIVTIDKNGILSHEQVHTLIATQAIKLSENDALDALHSVWNTAVSDRIECQDSLAFLSGGMDSRLLTHTLQTSGAKPHTANFAPPNSMDRVFAQSAAQAMSIPLWIHPTGSLNIDFVTDTVNLWTQSSIDLRTIFRHRKIWSGDGGSVGMGHVYLDDEMNRLCHDGAYEQCARRFCEINKRIPVSRAYRMQNTRELFESTIAKKLQEYGQNQSGRAAFYFLMLNDQRRHLDLHYETIHLRQFDFTLPFFDRRLIELVSSLPATQFNCHRMYDRLFHKIGGTLTSTPWQTYPGHEPCSLPKPPQLAYQWSKDFYSKSEKAKQRRKTATKSLAFALNPPTRQRIYNRPYIALASVSTLLGISDNSYIYQCIKPVL